MNRSKGSIKTYLRRDRQRKHAIMVTAEISYQGQGRKEIAIGALSYHKLAIVKIGDSLYGTYHYDSDQQRLGRIHIDITKLQPAEKLGFEEEFDEATRDSLLESLPEVSGFEVIARGLVKGPHLTVV